MKKNKFVVMLASLASCMILLAPGVFAGTSKSSPKADSKMAGGEMNFSVNEGNVSKWVSEIFLRHDEKYARKALKISANDYIFYGASQEKDRDFARTIAERRAEQAALATLRSELGYDVPGARIFSMELVRDEIASVEDEDGNEFFQVFMVFKVNASAWEKTKQQAK